MHDIAEQRPIVRIRIEIEIAAGGPQLMLDGLEDLMAVVNERIVVRPNLLDDLNARVMAVRVDGDQPAAGAERARQRPDYALGLELQRGARAVRLGSDDEVVIGLCAAGLLNDWIQQKAVVLDRSPAPPA